MTEIYNVHFGILMEAELPGDISKIADDWETTMKNKRSKVLENLQRVIADESDYLDKIVNRSNAGYKEFISESHPDYDKIMLKRLTKMPARASDYITNVNNAFAEGGAFEDGVTGNKGAFANNVKVILRVVGDKDKIFGAIPKLKFALNGKKDLLEDVLDSQVDHPITQDDLKPFFIKKTLNASVVATVNEALAYVVYALDAEWSDSDIQTKIADKYNPVLAAMINANTVNPELDAANCSIQIAKDATTGRWGIQFVEATP